MSHSIAIIGAGPAGCYTAQALRKAMKDAQITVIDRLPVPYGLVRYGVAGDHQGTKAVARQFARVFERQNVAFMGNVEVGRDVGLDELRGCFDAVVLAIGLYADRRLEVAGARARGIYGSGEVTRYWNGHTGSRAFAPEFGKRVGIIGNGNVAIDLVRLLGKSEPDFIGSDIDLEYLRHDVEEIHVIGRSEIGVAKFDIAMVKELAGIAGLRCSIAPGDSFTHTPISQAVKEVVEASPPRAARHVIFHSGWVCKRVVATDGQIVALDLAAREGGGAKRVECDSLVTAIGFDRGGGIASDEPPVGAPADESGVLGGGLFASGWFRRGSQGAIPTARVDAHEVAAKVAQWLGAQGESGKAAHDGILAKLRGKSTSYADWLAIDKHETENAAANRCRTKVRTLEGMLHIINAAKG